MNREAKVITPAQSYNMDGYHAASNTVYEYHGCIFHVCHKCYPKQGNMKRFCHPDRTVSEVYEATLKKTAILRDAGYTVIEMWGCNFAKQKETNPELAEFLENFEFVPPLEPRDAFFGGRTGLRPCTPKQQKRKRSAMLILLLCTPPLTNMELILWDSRRLSIGQKTRTLAITLVSRKWISWLLNACSTPFCLSGRVENLLFLFPGPVLKKR